MKISFKSVFDILWYVIIFFLIQFVTGIVVQAVVSWYGGHGITGMFSGQGMGHLNGQSMIAIAILSSLLSFLVFYYCRWARLSRAWFRSHQWTTLIWVFFLAIGTILPSQWMIEQMELSMPDYIEKMFDSILAEPLGYLAIGIVVPFVEEFVFRGAILGKLLTLWSPRKHWIPIFISALIFGAVHGNIVQFVHATLMGLLLGWLYYRTDSIFPGVVFHWVNNSIAYIMFHFFPQMSDGKLIDLFHGDARSMWMGLGFSLCLLLPSLYQLYFRMKHTHPCES